MIEIEERLSRIIAAELGVEATRITPNASFKSDLGADRLDFIELIVSVEEAFNIAIPASVVEKNRNGQRPDRLHQEQRALKRASTAGPAGDLCRLSVASSEPARMIAFPPFQGFIWGMSVYEPHPRSVG
jgi:acyl carrier protein